MKNPERYKHVSDNRILVLCCCSFSVDISVINSHVMMLFMKFLFPSIFFWIIFFFPQKEVMSVASLLSSIRVSADHGAGLSP